jgi:hypothetical protein
VEFWRSWIDVKAHAFYQFAGLRELRVSLRIDVSDAHGFGFAETFNHDADHGRSDAETFGKVLAATFGDVDESDPATADAGEPAERYDLAVDLGARLWP